MRVSRLSHSDDIAMSRSDASTALLDEGLLVGLERMVCNPRQRVGHIQQPNRAETLIQCFAFLRETKRRADALDIVCVLHRLALSTMDFCSRRAVPL